MVIEATIESTEKLQILKINIYISDYIMMLNLLQDFGERIKMGTKDRDRSSGLQGPSPIVVGTLFLFYLIFLFFMKHCFITYAQ